jgi:hypothetical protein
VPDTLALEAAHGILAVCNQEVEGEAPEAATGESLKKRPHDLLLACVWASAWGTWRPKVERHLIVGGVQSSRFTILTNQGHSALP